MKLKDLIEQQGLELGKVYTDKDLPPFKVNEVSDKIQIPGVGVSSYDNLKRNVYKKVQDLMKRCKKGDHTGLGESQFKLLGVMWKALGDYEEKMR
tara:strand:- start:192 stop:476 length:285 start_codon:yes stop_codon:yes gene_type:complete